MTSGIPTPACADCPEPTGRPAGGLCADCPDAPRPGVWVHVGPHRVRVDGAVYAWTEPRFHVWSAVLPLLLLPPAWHLLFHVQEPTATHAHTCLLAFVGLWLVCWVLAVPYTCHVAHADGHVDRITCATRGQALRLAAVVRAKVGAPG